METTTTNEEPRSFVPPAGVEYPRDDDDFVKHPDDPHPYNGLDGYPFRWWDYTEEEYAAGYARLAAEEALHGKASRKREPDPGDDIEHWLRPNHILNLDEEEPEQILKGVFCEGQIVSIQAGSKQRKTWFMKHLCYCIANGLPFLGIPTSSTERKVLDIDLELQEPFARKRWVQICNAIGDGDFHQLEILCLRGRPLDPDIMRQLAQMIYEESFKVFCLDPIYKLLGDRQRENDTSDVKRLLEPFVRLTAERNVTFLYSHHYSKGDHFGKEAIDRSSGSGVFGRLPDVIIDLSPHREPGVYIVEIIQRNFEDIAPFCVKWENFIFVREEGFDPKDGKRPKVKKGSTMPEYIEPDAALTYLMTLEEIPKSEFLERLMKPGKNGKPFCCRTRAWEITKILIETERLIETKINGKKHVKKA